MYFIAQLRLTRAFFDRLNLNIEKAHECSKNIILVGDLNEDMLNPNYHNLKDLILINNMKNVINESTRQQATGNPIFFMKTSPS